MRFRYLLEPTRRPVVALGGRWERPRPVVTVSVVGPANTVVRAALLDTGADDTVFPEWIATAAGIDLSQAPTGESAGVGGNPIPVRYAEVTLRLTDGQEFRTWKAVVAFTAAPLRRPLLGFAGVLQFFTATFHGDREEVELTVNPLYSGT